MLDKVPDGVFKKVYLVFLGMIIAEHPKACHSNLQLCLVDIEADIKALVKLLRVWFALLEADLSLLHKMKVGVDNKPGEEIL